MGWASQRYFCGEFNPEILRGAPPLDQASIVQPRLILMPSHQIVHGLAGHATDEWAWERVRLRCLRTEVTHLSDFGELG